MNTQSNPVSPFAVLLAAAPTSAGADLKKGQIVDGIYVGSGLVSCGTKYDHRLHSLDMEGVEDLRAGDRMRVMVTHDRSQEEEFDFSQTEGQCVVSRRFAQSFEELLAAKENSTSVKVRVLRPRLKGRNVVGMIAAFGPVLGFIPRSHFRHNPERAVGAELNVLVKDVDLARLNVLYDLRSQQEEEAKLQEALVQNRISELQIGEFFHGKVKKLIACGALVDIGGGVVGLLHHTEYLRVAAAPAEGDTVEVVVIGKREEEGRFNLSQRKAQPRVFAASHQPGDVFDGKVANVQTFGVFVEVVQGVRGLLHRSRYQKREFKVDDQVRVKLLSTTADGARVDLELAGE